MANQSQFDIPPSFSTTISPVSNPVISAHGLTKFYDTVTTEVAVRPLNDLDLEIPHGEFTAIMGSSGSGKSSLLKILAGLEDFQSGTVTVVGRHLGEMNPHEVTAFRRDKIGFIYQSCNLIPTLNVRENIGVPAALRRESVDENRFHTLVTELGLEPYLKSFPGELNLAQQQKVACARAFTIPRQVVFADEPTAKLDPKASAQVLAFLRAAAHDWEQTVVMATDDPDVAKYADRILFLFDGRIVAQLTHPTRDAILEAVKSLGSIRRATSTSHSRTVAEDDNSLTAMMTLPKLPQPEDTEAESAVKPVPAPPSPRPVSTPVSPYLREPEVPIPTSVPASTETPEPTRETETWEASETPGSKPASRNQEPETAIALAPDFPSPDLSAQAAPLAATPAKITPARASVFPKVTPQPTSASPLTQTDTAPVSQPVSPQPKPADQSESPTTGKFQWPSMDSVTPAPPGNADDLLGMPLTAVPANPELGWNLSSLAGSGNENEALADFDALIAGVSSSEDSSAATTPEPAPQPEPKPAPKPASNPGSSQIEPNWNPVTNEVADFTRVSLSPSAPQTPHPDPAPAAPQPDSNPKPLAPHRTSFREQLAKAAPSVTQPDRSIVLSPQSPVSLTDHEVVPLSPIKPEATGLEDAVIFNPSTSSSRILRESFVPTPPDPKVPAAPDVSEPAALAHATRHPVTASKPVEASKPEPVEKPAPAANIKPATKPVSETVASPAAAPIPTPATEPAATAPAPEPVREGPRRRRRPTVDRRQAEVEGKNELLAMIAQAEKLLAASDAAIDDATETLQETTLPAEKETRRHHATPRTMADPAKPTKTQGYRGNPNLPSRGTTPDQELLIARVDAMLAQAGTKSAGLQRDLKNLQAEHPDTSPDSRSRTNPRYTNDFPHYQPRNTEGR